MKAQEKALNGSRYSSPPTLAMDRREYTSSRITRGGAVEALRETPSVNQGMKGQSDIIEISPSGMFSRGIKLLTQSCVLPCQGFMIGAYREGCLIRLENLRYQDVNRLFSELTADFDTIETGPLNNGRVDIPPQQNSWSCGVNGAARMLAMLGQALPDYKEFHDHSPNHSLFHAETGPGTERLTLHIQRQQCCGNEFGGVFVGPNMTDDWEPQERLILQSLDLSRPILVLVEVADLALHWVNIVGRRKNPSGNFLVLNSNGFFCEIEGGMSALRQRMDLHGHIIHHVPLHADRVARFNSISATCGNLRPNRAYYRNMSYANVDLRGDRNGAHNVVNTIMDSPINPLSVIWRLF